MSFSKLASFVMVAALAAPALAHMEITTPPPFRSKSNPQYAGSPLIDYSYTAPLNKDGSNFPCKGYQVDLGSVASSNTTLTGGSDFTVNMSGSAVHNGGSCQFVLSYDGGKTFGVIHQVIGGCPQDPSYSFKIPDGVPAQKDVLFGWTWFNKSGNREMYMNCAPVNIEGGGSGLTVPRMFEANIFGEGTCETVEGVDIDFANPGAGVTNCPADKLITPDKTVSFGAGGSVAPSDPAPPADPTSTADPAPSTTPPADPSEDPCPPEEDPTTPPSSTEDPCPPEEDPTSAPSSSTQAPPPPASTTAPTAPPTTPPASGGSCQAGAVQCGADGKTWSLCANGAWVSMGAVAPGTTCANGAISRRLVSRLFGRNYRNAAV